MRVKKSPEKREKLLREIADLEANHEGIVRVWESLHAKAMNRPYSEETRSRLQAAHEASMERLRRHHREHLARLRGEL